MEINAANFPDAAFRQWILDAGLDTNRNGILSDDELSAVTDIFCEETGIQNLQGIEYFTSLTSLDCAFNGLTSLDVSRNTALQELTCFSNQLTELDVSRNTALTSLWCSYNALSSLDVSRNGALKKLYCDGNALTSLNISANPALTSLWCSHNGLTSLDLSKNTALRQLYCEDNRLSSLDVTQCPQILNTLRTDTQYEDFESWGYGNNGEGDFQITFDKTVRVYLGNGDYVGYAPTYAAVDALRYRLSGKNASVIAPNRQSAKTITIPKTIQASDNTYKVTAIEAGAFKGMSKLTKVTIGANVKSIGKSAFQNCKKLKTIDIKTSKLTKSNVKANAFKGIYKKATITCPKGKAAAYKKWLTKRGVPKTAKIK